MAVLFSIVGFGRPWAFAPAAVFALLALVRPGWLHPLNRAWSFLGRAIGTVVAPIVLGLSFFLVLTPMAFFARLFRRDALGLRLDRNAASYWVRRGDVPADLRRPY